VKIKRLLLSEHASRKTFKSDIKTSLKNFELHVDAIGSVDIDDRKGGTRDD
jgi:hypothetical protein